MKGMFDILILACTYLFIYFLFSDVHLLNSNIFWASDLFYCHDHTQVLHYIGLSHHLSESHVCETVDWDSLCFYWPWLGQCLWQRKEEEMIICYLEALSYILLLA